MVRSKAPSKKPQARGVDFKKYKKKLGRKLPPPSTATNTEIKSKAIILPEQSVALDKEGVPVSKKGLTLKELLQQTSHHNVKVRKDALLGIRDLLLKFPDELKLHKNTIIEKLRERISDDDKTVRETLYQLFKSIILPGCKEDIQGAPISFIMAYIFKAMTHLVMDVRFMAFKFFDLVVQNYPPAFFTYAEKSLDNYMDLLHKSQFHFEDKSKLKFVLSSLVRCLSLLPSNEREVHSSSKGDAEKEVLHSYERDEPTNFNGQILIVGKLEDLVSILVNCLNGFLSMATTQPQLDSHSFDCMLSILKSIDVIVQYNICETGNSFASSEIRIQYEKQPALPLDKLFAVFPLQATNSLVEEDDHYDRKYFILNAIICRIFFTFNQCICPFPFLCNKFLSCLEDWLFEIYKSDKSDKGFYDKHLPSLVPFIPHLVSAFDDQEHRLLKAFTMAFENCSSDSTMKMACLKAVEEMLVQKQEILFSEVGDKVILDCQKSWINEIGLLLNSLGNKNPSNSHVVLGLLLRLGQIGLANSDLAMEYDKLQDELQKFYCLSLENGHICYGPFMELPQDSQEISICCLYYFSSLTPQLLTSLALCCLSNSLDSSIILRIVEVLHSSYEAGHIHITDFTSFLVTFLSQYEVNPDSTCDSMKKEANLLTFRLVTGRICSFLSQMGDRSLLFQILEDVVVDLISLGLPMDNTCSLLGMLIAVDSNPTTFSEKSVMKLGAIIFSYVIDVALLFPEHEGQIASNGSCTWQYYLLPCFILLARIPKFPKHLLDKMVSFIDESCDVPLLRDTELARDSPRKIKAVVSIFKMMFTDPKMRRILSSCKTEIDEILQRILLVQSSFSGSLNIEQQHHVQVASESMKNMISEIFSVTS